MLPHPLLSLLCEHIKKASWWCGEGSCAEITKIKITIALLEGGFSVGTVNCNNRELLKVLEQSSCLSLLGLLYQNAIN